MQHQALGDDVRLRLPIAPHELPRLQRLFLTSASMHLQSGSTTEAMRDYFKGVEIITQTPAEVLALDSPYTMREFILACFVAGYLVQNTEADKVLPPDLADCLTPAFVSTQTGYDLLRAVRSSSDRILAILLRLGRNALPFLLLLPDQIARLPSVLFPASSGVFPAICNWDNGDSSPQLPNELVRQQANSMTGNIFLAMAKYYQDLSSNSVDLPGFDHKLNVNHALAIMLYYLALALAPAPSTYNNMGIILSTISDTTSWTTESGEHTVLNGSDLARIYYNIGLQMDPSHPHLLTNLGSLYKDQGNLGEAIQYVLHFLTLRDVISSTQSFTEQTLRKGPFR